MMGIAFYIVWIKVEENKIRTKAIIFYFIQLVLNFCWSIIFFYAAKPGWAFAEIVLLWIMIAATINKFSKISKPAAWLLVPYILWVSFAAVLNFAIWRLNS
jgi:tryptophan-rich sensory protein